MSIKEYAPLSEREVLEFFILFEILILIFLIHRTLALLRCLDNASERSV